jgi:hypothetical protein
MRKLFCRKNMSELIDKEKIDQQKIVAQLRAEVKIERIKVSVACTELIKYCEAHQSTDVLVSGFVNCPNPFEPRRKPCVII